MSQLAQVRNSTEFFGRRANDCLRRAKSFQQSGRQPRTQAGHQVQRQESLQLGIQSHGSVPESRSFSGPCKQESPQSSGFIVEMTRKKCRKKNTKSPRGAARGRCILDAEVRRNLVVVPVTAVAR